MNITLKYVFSKSMNLWLLQRIRRKERRKMGRKEERGDRGGERRI